MAQAQATLDQPGKQDVDLDPGAALANADRLLDQGVALLPSLGVGLVIFLLFWFVAKVVRYATERMSAFKHSADLAKAIGRLVQAGLLLVGFLIAMTVIFPSVTPARLLSVLGVGGVAIGFAFKDIFQNFLAGILLLIRHPFRTGDEIATGAFTGTVEAIETRATFIRTYDGRRIVVPNLQIYSEPVSVITAYNLLRTEVDIGIGYGDDIGNAKRIALDTVRQVEGVLQEPAADVLTWELAESWITLRVRWWTTPQRHEVLAVRDCVLERVREAFAGAGIDLPFPTRVVLFHDQTDANDGDRAKQREGWPAGNNPPPARRIGQALQCINHKGEANEHNHAS